MEEGTLNGSLQSTVLGIVQELRPHQWYKQGVLLLGITFSQNLFSPNAWIQVFLAVVAFTAVAGAIYIFNDISDIEEDRGHPQKQYRPIASGQVSVSLASTIGLLLVAGGLILAYLTAPLLLPVVGAYFVLTSAYSWFLKDIALVDVIVVGVGFVLRAVAGVVAIDVALSPWLIVCTFLLALILALGKRRHELETTEPGTRRQALDDYTSTMLDQQLVISMATLLMAYTLYSFFRADSTMMLTLPFAFFGVFRYHQLVHTSDVAGQPEFILTDSHSVVNLALWTLTTVAVIYDVPHLVVTALP